MQYGRLCSLRDWEEEVKAMYAIIENGGKQYKVCRGRRGESGEAQRRSGRGVSFNVVMIADGSAVKVGQDVASAKVTATVQAQDKYKKIIVFKYKAKKNERKKQGHRQPFTRCQDREDRSLTHGHFARKFSIKEITNMFFISLFAHKKGTGSLLYVYLL